MKFSLFICLVWALFSPSNVYSNDYYIGTMLNGTPREFFGGADKHCKFIGFVKRDGAYWARVLAKMERGLAVVKGKITSAEKGTYQYNLLMDDFYKLANNKAHCFIFLNRVDEALVMLLELEKKLPGESKFAENLAFCYEKKKDYNKALQWIQLAIKRNSMAAYSNIWVYEKILYVRQQLVKDPDYLKKNRVFNLGVKREGDLEFINQLTRENLNKRGKMLSKSKHIKQRIQLQLQRNPHGNDPVIAAMILDLATIYAITEVCEVALPVFELALKHNPVDEDLVHRRVRQMKKTIAANDLSMTSSRPFLQQFQTVSLTIFGLIFVVIFGAIGYWYIRRKKKNKM